MSDEERKEMIDDFRKWFREHIKSILIVKPDDMSDAEFEDWEG